MIKSGTTLFTDHILRLQVDLGKRTMKMFYNDGGHLVYIPIDIKKNLVYMLREIGVPSSAVRAFRLKLYHKTETAQVRNKILQNIILKRE